MPQSNYTLKCIERAVAFMSEKADAGNTPPLEDMAKAAGLSRYHFNRIYKLATGETPQETLTRFKLARATKQLRDPTVSVTEAAFTAGYGSSQSFAEALKRVLATSATAIRTDEGRLTDAIERLMVPRAADDAERPDLSVEIAQIEPFEAIAMRTDGTYPTLNVVYEALFRAVGGPAYVAAILGRPFGNIAVAETKGSRFDCALKITDEAQNLTDGLARTTVDGGVYLLTRHVGSYDDLSEAIDRLYLTTLSQSDIEIADDPLLFHYLDDPESTGEADLRTDIYLRLKAEFIL